MSEQSDSTVPLVLMIVLVFIAMIALAFVDQAEIRDLQRRVAELEQRR